MNAAANRPARRPGFMKRFLLFVVGIMFYIIMSFSTFSWTITFFGSAKKRLSLPQVIRLARRGVSNQRVIDLADTAIDSVDTAIDLADTAIDSVDTAIELAETVIDLADTLQAENEQLMACNQRAQAQNEQLMARNLQLQAQNQGVRDNLVQQVQFMLWECSETEMAAHIHELLVDKEELAARNQEMAARILGLLVEKEVCIDTLVEQHQAMTKHSMIVAGHYHRQTLLLDKNKILLEQDVQQAKAAQQLIENEQKLFQYNLNKLGRQIQALRGGDEPKTTNTGVDGGLHDVDVGKP